MRTGRRSFLGTTLGAAAAWATRDLAALAADSETSLFNLRRQIDTPVKLARVELLRHGREFLVRATSADGAVGLAAGSERLQYLYPIFLQRIAPYFVGKDARDIESLVDGVYVHQSNYKLAGVPFWVCVGCAEAAIFDLLGKIAKKSVGELLGGVVRRSVPVYLSSLRRDTTPEQEVAWLGERLRETGAKAVKLKIGGRMSRNADASPGRTERLVPLARKTFGDAVTIQVDANGSYDASHAIEVGRMLADHGVYFYEEPCPWEDFEATKQVADALDINVAGGEQDTSLDKFEWMIQHRAIDIVQPDVIYNGGFVRTTRVARLAAAAKMDITPHAPQAGLQWACLVQFASAMPNLGRFQEYNGAKSKQPDWFQPHFDVKDGVVAVPAGPGLGMTIDESFVKQAKVVSE